jgi:hypothetical protein
MRSILSILLLLTAAPAFAANHDCTCSDKCQKACENGKSKSCKCKHCDCAKGKECTKCHPKDGATTEAPKAQ